MLAHCRISEGGKVFADVRKETVSSLLVTVQGPDERVELALSGDRPVRELLPLLVDVCAASRRDPDARWELAPLGGLAFDASKTLTEVGVMDGSLLHFRNVATSEAIFAELPPMEEGDPAVAHDQFGEHLVLPQDRTRMVLPPRIPLTERVAALVQAAIRPEAGVARPPAAEPLPGEIVRPASLTRRGHAGLADRLRATWRATDYVYLLEEAIVAPQLLRCATVAVMSPKGGVGKTTTTTLLGSLFALLRRDRIVAIDTNPDFGSLGRQLAPEHTVFLDDLYEVLDEPELTAAALDNHLGRAAHGLMVLPAPTDPARASRIDTAAYVRVIGKLQQMVGLIVLDSGTGLHEPAARAALATADQIVLVSDAEPATASLVAEAAAVLKQEERPLYLVMNKAGEPTDLDLQAFGAVIPHARGLVEVGSELFAARAVTSGRFTWTDAPRSWTRALRELAAALVADWPELGIAG
jgi:MinD-like ATPase involved in chromosome partitioning or flagellar assembly